MNWASFKSFMNLYESGLAINLKWLCLIVNLVKRILLQIDRYLLDTKSKCNFAIWSKILYFFFKITRNLFVDSQMHNTIYFILRTRSSRMASRKSSVLRNIPSFTLDRPWMQPAKSLVILPLSTVSMQAFSRANANLANSGVPSSLARCSKPIDNKCFWLGISK